jgi:hypothetical protein
VEYKIERLGVAGALACRFEHEGRRYSAQVDKILGGGTGCTICPECGFDELYTKDNVPLTEEGLIDCIGAFIAKMDADQGRGSGHEKTCTVCRSVSV